MTVASKMCRWLLCASATQTSLSSRVNAIPWLGQPCRLTGPPFESLDFNAIELLARVDVADLESQEIVNVDKGKEIACR